MTILENENKCNSSLFMFFEVNNSDLVRRSNHKVLQFGFLSVVALNLLMDSTEFSNFRQALSCFCETTFGY